jgi:hypothetical protein
MRHRSFLIVTLAVGLPSGAVLAQPPLAARPVVAHVAAGYAAPAGVATDFFDAGWQASAGATFHFSPAVPVGMRLDLGYTQFPAIGQSLETGTFPAQVQVDDGHLAVGHLMLDALWEFGGRGHVGGWLGVGAGVLHRRTTVTTTAPIGVLCPDDLAFSICPPSRASERVETHDQLTQTGFDVTAAVRFPLPSGSELYLEARYQRMDTDPATEFVPIVAGFRW